MADPETPAAPLPAASASAQPAPVPAEKPATPPPAAGGMVGSVTAAGAAVTPAAAVGAIAAAKPDTQEEAAKKAAIAAKEDADRLTKEREEKRPGGFLGFLRDYSPLVLGGIAAAVSGILEGGWITTLIVGAGTFLLGSAFKDKIGGFLNGFNKTEPSDEEKKAREKQKQLEAAVAGMGQSTEKAATADERAATAEDVKKLSDLINKNSPEALKVVLDRDKDSKIIQDEVLAFAKDVVAHGVKFSPEQVTELRTQLANKGVQIEATGKAQ